MKNINWRNKVLKNVCSKKFYNSNNKYQIYKTLTLKYYKMPILLSKICFLLLFSTYSILEGLTNANTNWAKLAKKIAIHPGKNISAWLDRGIVSNMQPAGDGTYIIKLDLTPGYEYNFIFFAVTSNNPPDGLDAYFTYYDQVPSKGRILTSINSNGTSWNTNYAYYGPVGKYFDARRIIFVPEFGSGTNLYVFNNFSDKPLPPEKFEALPQNNKVILNWSYPKGNWNQIDPNVIAGGKYLIYTNTTSITSAFGLLATINGNVTSFTHTGLVNGKTYYYAIISSDAYSAPSGLALTNMKSSTSNKSFATPNDSIPVYFKVQNNLFKIQEANWNKIAENNYLAFFTPLNCDARFYFNKIPVRVTRVILK